MASGGHPCPSLLGQPQASALPLGPRVLREVNWDWGGHFCFLSGFFPISVKAATAERTVFSTAASLNELKPSALKWDFMSRWDWGWWGIWQQSYVVPVQQKRSDPFLLQANIQPLLDVRSQWQCPQL